MLSCVPDQPEGAGPELDKDPLARAITAHGGLDLWQSFRTVTFDIVREESVVRNTVDLRTRKARMSAEDYDIGFDGEDVWVMPDLEAFSGSASFYNGLDFYFFGMPFVLADPGTIHSDIGLVTVGGEPYHAVRVAYEAGVGASSEDSYVAHFDVETHRLRFLLYTVTYFTGEPNENYNVRVYDEWQEIQGLQVPLRATSYAWNPDLREFGEMRSEASYTNVSLEAAPADPMMFVMPDGAMVDTSGGG